jgi:Zn-dependent protease/CBS domain-containing protein
MFTARWRLFRVFGIPIYVDASWLIILALLTWTLSTAFATELKGIAVGVAIGLGLVGAISFFICIVLHELGHAIVGRAQGMDIRGITLFLFGGVAELQDEPRSARAEFLMAIAGPVVSATLALLCWLGAISVPFLEAGLVLAYLAQINWIVLVFNMVPAFPLDGGRVFRSALWAVTGNLRRATYWASTAGQGFAWLLIGLGILSFFGRDVGNGIWLVLIGVFLNNAARASYRSMLVRQLLEGEPIRRFMNPHPLIVSPLLDVRAFVEDFVYRHHRKAFPVVLDGHLIGFITTRQLAGISREDWDQHTVGELMKQDFQAFCISPATDALHALQQMQRTGSSRLLVTDGEELRGIVSLKDLLKFLSLKMELEGPDNRQRSRPGGSWQGVARRKEESVPH